MPEDTVQRSISASTIEERGVFLPDLVFFVNQALLHLVRIVILLSPNHCGSDLSALSRRTAVDTRRALSLGNAAQKSQGSRKRLDFCMRQFTHVYCGEARRICCRLTRQLGGARSCTMPCMFPAGSTLSAYLSLIRTTRAEGKLQSCTQCWFINP